MKADTERGGRGGGYVRIGGEVSARGKITNETERAEKKVSGVRFFFRSCQDKKEQDNTFEGRESRVVVIEVLIFFCLQQSLSQVYVYCSRVRIVIIIVIIHHIIRYQL
jgi:hypothetical protein